MARSILLAVAMVLTCGRAVYGATLPNLDHVVIVIEENHGFGQIIGSSATPYLNTLAAQGANFTQSFAITHPSQPNYLALYSGSTQGITDDSTPHAFTTANLGAAVIAKGLTFTGYSENLPAAGSTVSTATGSYARKHNPWVNWQGASANGIPTADNQPFSAFPADFTKLPTVSFVIPDLLDDMHDGTPAVGDTWLQAHLDGYVQWAKSHNSLLIVTWDEDDDTTTANQIPTLFVGARVLVGSYSERIDHYRVLRTVEDLYGLGHSGNAATATAIADCWTVPPTITAQPASRTVSAGQSASFSVTASGTPAPGLRWQRNGTDLAGATSATYTTPATVAADNGATYRCIATNSAGSATSAVATLTVTTVAPTPPTAVTPAHGPAAPATGTTAALAVLGGPAANEAALTYTWSVVSAPSGGNASFAPNGGNAAKQTTMTFDRAGTWQVQVSIADPAHATMTISGPLNVVVAATFASAVVTGPASVASGGIAQFAVRGRDQFGQVLTTQPTFAWSAAGGAIDGGGIFTAGAVGSAQITASSGAVSGHASVTITAAGSGAGGGATATSGGGGHSCGLGAGVALIGIGLFGGAGFSRRRRRRN